MAVHAALIAMGGELGLELDLSKLPTSESLTDTQCLYSESAGRFIVTVAPENRIPFEKLMSGLACGCVGRVSKEPVLAIRGKRGEKIIMEDLLELKKVWEKPFGGLI